MIKAALDRVVELYRSSLYMPDPSQIYAMLGTIAGNTIKGEPPVWLIVVGPPSSGKSEPLKYLLCLPKHYPGGEMTGPGLLSCSPAKSKGPAATGGLLTTIGEWGVIIVSDMSPILSLHPEKLKSFLSLMRDVYDGCVTRHGGADGGMSRHWRGKVGLIAAATGAIDRHHSVINSLGDRYLYFRMPVSDIRAKMAANRVRSADKTKLKEALTALMDLVSAADVPELSQEDVKTLESISVLVATLRTATCRDPITRKIEDLDDVEEPMRLERTLTNLYRGMRMVGVEPDQAIATTCKVALDSIPPARLAVLRVIVPSPVPVTFSDASQVSGNFADTAVRRALEDLVAYKVIEQEGVNGVPYRYSKSKWLLESLAGLPEGTFPVISSDLLSKKENNMLTGEHPINRERSIPPPATDISEKPGSDPFGAIFDPKE